MSSTLYLLDTNVILHLANKSSGWERIEERLLKHPSTRVALASVVAFELQLKLITGQGRIQRRALELVAALLAQFRVLPLRKQEATMAALVLGELRRMGKGIGERDAMIAGTALIHHAVIVTDNVSEFSRVPGLGWENWRA